MKTVDFSESIAASDLKFGRCRQLIEFMKLCEYRRSMSFLSIYFPGFVCFVLYYAKISGERLQDHWSSGLPYIFQVLYVLCFTRPRYQVSVNRTIGPLVIKRGADNRDN